MKRIIGDRKLSKTEAARIGKIRKKVEREFVPTNLNKPPIRIAHSSLKPLSGDSDYRMKCPVCKKGFLMMRRDPHHNNRLSAVDNCILCGQLFIYTDIERLRKSPIEIALQQLRSDLNPNLSKSHE